MEQFRIFGHNVDSSAPCDEYEDNLDDVKIEDVPIALKNVDSPTPCAEFEELLDVKVEEPDQPIELKIHFNREDDIPRKNLSPKKYLIKTLKYNDVQCEPKEEPDPYLDITCTGNSSLSNSAINTEEEYDPNLDTTYSGNNKCNNDINFELRKQYNSYLDMNGSGNLSLSNPAITHDNSHLDMKSSRNSSLNNPAFTPDTSSKIFHCHKVECTFKTNNESKLKEHIRHHKGKQCIYCDMYFAEKCNLEKHIDTCTGEKQYQCSKCDKHFADKNDLEEHENTHIHKKSHQCSYCGSILAYKTNLYKHLRSKCKAKPHQCKQCDNRYLNKNDLVQHIMMHILEGEHYSIQWNKT